MPRSSRLLGHGWLCVRALACSQEACSVHFMLSPVCVESKCTGAQQDMIRTSPACSGRGHGTIQLRVMLHLQLLGLMLLGAWCAWLAELLEAAACSASCLHCPHLALILKKAEGHCHLQHRLPQQPAPAGHQDRPHECSCMQWRSK